MLPTLMTVALLTQAPPSSSHVAPWPVERRILQVNAARAQEEHRLFIAPGVLTSILLDTPIRLDTLRVEDETHFRRFVKDTQALFLMPSQEQVGKEPLSVQLEYADKASPRALHLLLVVDDTLAERQVEVSREALSAEQLEMRLKQAEALLEAKDRELQQLRATQGPPRSLIEATRQGWMDWRGMAMQQLRAPKARSGAPWVARDIRTFRSSGRVMVWVQGQVDAGFKWPRPLAAEDVLVVDAAGNRLTVVDVRRDELMQVHGESFQLMVELVASEDEAHGTWFLKLRKEDSETLSTVAEVAFPPLPKLPAFL